MKMGLNKIVLIAGLAVIQISCSAFYPTAVDENKDGDTKTDNDDNNDDSSETKAIKKGEGLVYKYYNIPALSGSALQTFQFSVTPEIQIDSKVYYNSFFPLEPLKKNVPTISANLVFKKKGNVGINLEGTFNKPKGPCTVYVDGGADGISSAYCKINSSETKWTAGTTYKVKMVLSQEDKTLSVNLTDAAGAVVGNIVIPKEFFEVDRFGFSESMGYFISAEDKYTSCDKVKASKFSVTTPIFGDAPTVPSDVKIHDACKATAKTETCNNETCTISIN